MPYSVTTQRTSARASATGSSGPSATRMAGCPAGVRDAMQITGVPRAARSAPRWKSGPVDTPPYSWPSSCSVHTWPDRSIENAWVTETMRSCRAITVRVADVLDGVQREPLVGLEQVVEPPGAHRPAADDRAGDHARLDQVGDRLGEHLGVHGEVAPVAQVRSIWLGTRPSPICRVDRSSTSRAT